LNPNIKNWDQFESDIEEVCEAYHNAVDNEKHGIHTISVDEKTGIQALEREAPTQPMIPGSVEKREYAALRVALLPPNGTVRPVCLAT